MFHIFLDILRNSVLITGLVVIMMMMIESFNIESRGKFFSGLRSSRLGQVLIGAFLGAVPGCMGGFATVSLYTHGTMTFGALVAMMIASSGDEAFVMLAMIPDKAMLIFTILFITAVVAGLLTDFISERLGKRRAAAESAGCGTGYEIHPDDCEDGHSHSLDAEEKAHRHFTWKRVAMFAGVAVFITALAFGFLEHEHGHGEEMTSGLNLLSEDWMNILFAVLSIAVLGVLAFASDHFVEEHLWEHIVKKHLAGIFAWTFGVLAAIAVLMHCIDISGWISSNIPLMILLAVAIGIIPESGPHLIFVTLYASGIVPLPVLLASCISQDGHASLPLIAENKKAFFKAKAINCLIALAVGFAALAIC